MGDTTTRQAAAAAAEKEEGPSSALALRSFTDYTIGAIPTLFYVPDFISHSEQSQLLHHLLAFLDTVFGCAGGVVHEKGLLPQALPSWLTRITNRICQWTGLFPSAINHVLINEYHSNQGIMPHQDGPAYYPVVAIISLASPVVIDFTPHQRLKEQEHTDPQNVQTDELPGPSKMESNGFGSHERGATNESDPASSSLMLMPCSLLIFKDQAYTGHEFVAVSRIEASKFRLYPRDHG
ncbi:hypothetical protein BAE44_0023839 [Dichanthelium oligosanthes]|uniref:Uncharacterized protein n=1 Tax=Dichanthelium oligosanthes TaxID=888268 RepID=A0A1E5UQG3_9POAL|nr:hypothetical protein BAE44_0023839 [Dichanthelium oligosanthes]